MTRRSPQTMSEMLRRWFGNERSRALEPGAELFERFMRHLPGLAWLKDVSGKFVYANDAMLKALGCQSSSELVGRIEIGMLVDAAHQPNAAAAFATIGEAGVSSVETFRHTDGTPHQVLVTEFPVFDEQDAATLIGGIGIDITDRVNTEERLRRSEERLRLATKAGKLGVWDWDITADQIERTGSLYSSHGMGRVTTLETFMEFIHPEDRAMVMQAIARGQQDAQGFEIECRALREDGAGIVWLYTTVEVVVENGKPVRMVGATLDVTARKQTELALRESEERFAKAFNASPLALTLSSLTTGKLLEMNDTFCHLTGYRREEALGRTTAELDLWAHPADSEAELARVRGSGSVRDQEYRFRTRGGKEIIVLLSAEKVIIGGEPCVLTIIRDITARAHAVRALHLNEQRMRLALAGANAGAWVYDPDPEHAFWSAEFRALFGFSADTPCSLEILLARLHPDDRDPIREQFMSMLRQGEGDFSHEFRILHPQLGLRWMLTLGRVERTERIVTCHGISLDISRSKQVEDQLRREDQRKNEFLATLAHELRNPLAPIRNGLEILRLTQGNGEMAQQARAMMERQLRQMVRLIDDLLDLSRISRGKIELKCERAELAAVVQNALEVSRPLIEQAGHQLTLELTSDALIVHADTTRLAQVFANLLNNAAKYTNDAGHIRVLVQREGAQALVKVRDNGVGMPTEMLPKVFDMFVQIDRSLEKAQGGLGIGLNIARQLVEMHGGTIEARSEGVGQGSEFIVRLPLVESGARIVPDIRSDPAKHASGLRILVADDNLDAANSLAMMLTLNGNEVRTARDGVEAVELVRTFLPQIVLLDIGMPRLNGYDACRRLREMPALAGCLIVATTGWGQEDDIQRSIEAGFDHHLVKPVEARVLEDLLAREFPRPRRSVP